ncbi:unnamed protein product [Hapterophycus canaliculatus]
MSLTMGSVGKMTTYQLRQEADARGLLKGLRHVNHGTLLKRLVQVIVEEEHERGRRGSQGAAGPSHSELEKERTRKERDERKAAAIERSKQRQADLSYFNTKKLSNVKYEGKSVVHVSSEQEEEVSVINPRRHKIFVR